MDIDALLNKIASSDVVLNPSVLDVVRRVRSVGLHKTAEALTGRETSMKTAVAVLGAKMQFRRSKYNKIAAAIAALENADSDI